jgi:ribosomal protein S18 acetylase RimI-like enzyme
MTEFSSWPPNVTLRPITPEDVPFLQRVYASTRTEELAPVPWTDQRKDEFLAMQFRQQHEYYQQRYRAAAFDVILVDGRPAGRLYIDRRPTDLHVIDIAFLPEFRGAGLGTAILRALREEAAASSHTMSIYVEKMNRALGLYERLGFVRIDDTEVYWLMEWRPVS